MGVVPNLKTSCFCCSLKTGSFVTAWFLLVGAGVQVGYYAFLVDHTYPQVMCTAYHSVLVKVDPPPRRESSHDYDYYGPGEDDYTDIFHRHWFDYWHRPPRNNGRPKGQAATNETGGGQTNTSYAANTTKGEITKPTDAANTTDSAPVNSSNAANITGGVQTNSSYAANSTDGGPRNSSNADRNNSTVSNRRPPWWRPRNRGWQRWNWANSFFSPYPQHQVVYKVYLRPCVRDYKPFDADDGLLDFDLRIPSHKFNKLILYFNMGLWVILMAASIPLMVAVYKESAWLIGCWLVAETLLQAVATASALATAVSLFRAVPVQIGIVTILNMAIHLGINIYLMMVVENYRLRLTGEVVDQDRSDEAEAEQVTVSVAQNGAC